MLWEVILTSLAVSVVWAYKALGPPPPRPCVASGPRMKLRDGRYLSYKEYGVPKEKANYNIILLHGFGSCKLEEPFPKSVIHI